MRDTPPSTETDNCGNCDSDIDSDNQDDGWWRTANLGECPITLECFSTLVYPPFALYHPGKTPPTASTDGCTKSDGVVAYFDGLALASYIVSRGVFQNPLTRNELTAEDCRRLDQYLEVHCYSSDAATATTMFRGSRVISVAEAFALRNSVSVETTTIRSDGRQSNANNERDRERIQTLRNSAIAALAGLFVYGNDRRRYTNEITQHVPQLRNEASVTVPINDWGFDLSRRVEDTSVQGTHGYAVIDDDEAVAVSSQRHSYETVQKAFPPLKESASQNSHGCKPNHCTIVFPDEHLLERIRTLSTRDEDEQSRHVRKVERAREQLLRQALERRKQRRKDRIDYLARNAEVYASQRKDDAELEKARMEIEEWRDDQWEKLRLLSEHEQHRKTERKNNALSTLNSRDQKYHSHEVADDSDKGKAQNVADDGETICGDVTKEKKKAKAAAKRKRAKDRKKAIKALEKEEAEKIRQRQAEKARRAASALKCSACGTGILKPSLAFERFDQFFCCPKCARTALKLDPA